MLISHASKVMLSILQPWQYMNQELPDVKAGFRKGRETKNQIASILWIIEKAREFQKYIYFCFVDYFFKTLTVWITTKCGKFLKRWEYQIILPASCETCMQIKKQRLELNITTAGACVLSCFSHVRVCDPMDCSQPSSFVHGIL